MHFVHAPIHKITSGGGGVGGPENLFYSSTHFTEGHMDLLREAIGPDRFYSVAS